MSSAADSKVEADEKVFSSADHVERVEAAQDARDPILTNEDPILKRVKRKIDLRLSAVLALMYVVNQIDRGNVSNAVVAGMKNDLDLIGNRYTIIVVIFFPFYIIANPIATVLARKLGPRPFCSGITFAFGIVVIGFGLVHDWKDQVGLRVLLGLFEGGFFPSAVFLVSMYYIRAEVAKRMAFFYAVGNSLGGFGGILAYGLQQMNGVSGKAGWRWIFIWEGIITIVISIVGYIFLVDFPEDASKNWKFLSPDELDVVIDRVDRDRADAHLEPFSFGHYLRQGLDWKVWFFAINFGMSAVVTYSVIYFLPILLREDLGMSLAESLCLTAPCYAFSGLLTFFESYISDKYLIRGHILLFNGCLQIIGVGLLGYSHVQGVRYFGAFLITGGSNGNTPAALTYQANNIVGQWKRAFTSATIVAAGALGGIVGSTVFRSQDSPTYRPGLYTCFTAAAIGMLSVCITSVYMFVQNRKQAKGLVVIEKTPGFRYTL